MVTDRTFSIEEAAVVGDVLDVFDIDLNGMYMELNDYCNA